MFAIEAKTSELSFAQERLWFLDRLEPQSAAYNLVTARRLSGRLALAALERALGEIVRRHDTLRTTFADVDGVPVQVIAPCCELTLSLVDLSALDAPARDAEVRRMVAEEARHSFDLATGPLFRAALLRLGRDEHVLLLNMHHIITDAWSMTVLFREMQALYAAYREGRASPLPELAMQYAEYAAWQRAHLTGDTLEALLAYWTAQLAGAPALLAIATDYPRPPRQTHRGAREPLALSAALIASLRALGRGETATLYMVLLAAFQRWLAQYSGSQDIVVGSPIAGRPSKAAEALIGFFANTLALRADLSGDPTFRQLLRRLRRTVLDAFAHQDLPFERLVSALHPERSLSHSPIVQALFNVYTRANPSPADLRMDDVPVDAETTKFDVALYLTTSGDGAAGLLSYSTDLFDRHTIRRMLGHFTRLLAQIAANPDVRLSELECLDETERLQVLETWNRIERPDADDRDVHRRFETWAIATPHADAVACENGTLTYTELNARANQLAHYLQTLGVGPDARVGIGLERGLEAIVALLAVLKAGGAYVPYDTSVPAERLAGLAADAGITLLVTQASLRQRFAGVDVRTITIDRDAAAWADASTSNPMPLDVGPNRLAYVIYTSGSTGVPNGVMVSHGALRNYVDAVAQRLALRPGWRYGLVSTFAADLGHTVLFPSLTTGGVLQVVSQSALSDPARFAATFRSRPVDVLKIVPSHLDAMLSGDAPASALPRRLLVCGGERLTAKLMQRVRALAPVCEVANHYGPTETTVGVIAQTVADEAIERHVPLGRPLGNTRCYVLNAAMRPLPVGIPGELYVGGPQVARGYLGRPRLTATRFVPDPFGSDGERLYRTGDQVRWRPDGKLEFLGRLDGQVKIRGFRVEPAEIEHVLSEHPDVREVRVIVRENDDAAAQLIAYVVGSAERDALRVHMRRRLPEYLVPSSIVLLDRLPLTPNGKLDARALPSPACASTDGADGPSTPIEGVLAGIWAEVLRADRVGRDDDFFGLGGDSLRAIRVMARIRDLLGVELPVVRLFESSLSELAGEVERWRRAAPALPPIVAGARPAVIPLSYAQERLWFLDRLEPGQAVYNVPRAWRLVGALDVAALQGAVAAIVARHEVLRTTFAEGEGLPRQVIGAGARWRLARVDLSGLDAPVREAAAQRLVRTVATAPFDLTRGPLVRGQVVRLDATTHVLVLCLHHAISDGWSLDVLVGELTTQYAAGGGAALPPLALQYADYALWQRAHLQGPAYATALAWWRAQLAGVPALLALPTDHPRPALQVHRGGRQQWTLPAALPAALQTLGQREGATLFMVLLAAVQLVLSKYTGCDDLLVGSPVAGRPRRELEPLIGFFVNTLMLRGDLSGDPRVREVLRRVRATTLDAFEHQEVPFEQLVAELQPERSLSHAPFVQVLVVLGEPAGVPRWPGVTVTPLAVDTATTKFDLVIGMTPAAGGLQLTLTYSAALFEPATIGRWGAHLTRVLTEMVAAPDQRSSALPLLTAAERVELLETWNQTAAAVPACTLPQLVEAQARATPAAVALRHDEARLTYGALQARANQVARHLRRLGVGPEQTVGVCVARGVELGVALLGVLNAGGAYVPLDPQYPRERVAFMLAHSGARVLLTQTALRAQWPAPADGLVVVCVDDPALARESAAPVASGVTPANLAYVIYTSGSTGTPKAVAIAHQSAVALVSWGTQVYGRAALAGMLAGTSICFDLSVFELFVPLAVGGCVIVVEHALAIATTAAAQAGRVINTVPSAIRELLHADGLPAGVTTVNLAGEPLTQDVVEALYARGIAQVYDLYGPSETTTYSTAARRVPGGRATIGRPIANTRAYVLDRGGAPVPIGIPGELYLGGAGLARGYLGAAAATASRFGPDPFGAAPGGRLYRTGDRVRWRADGTLEYLGRIDRQVKLRGFRIEPGEIEAALRTHPAVTDARVVVRAADGTAPQLVAYVIGAVEAEPLRAHLRQRLPEYLVPAAFLTLAAWPLTPTGKVDVRALPAPTRPPAAGAVRPRTPVEAQVAAVWRRVLGLADTAALDIHRNFFELGGNSLLVLRVVSRVREVCEIELPVRAIFEYPTIAELAEEVERWRRAAPALPPIVAGARPAVIPLSYAQERLWFLDRLEPGQAVYNVPRAWRLVGALDVAALQGAVAAIVARHEVLRTTFAEGEGLPRQVIGAGARWRLARVDLSGLDAPVREAAAQRLVRTVATAPFDLTRGPLVRGQVVRLDATTHVLVLCLHHAISDGWSLDVLVGELTTQYAAGGGAALPPLALQYADYALWQRAHLQGPAYATALAWWRAQLAGVPALLALPTDHPRPALQVHRGGRQQWTLPAALPAALQTLGQREGATLFMVLLAAVQLVLSKYTGCDDLLVGSPVAGRPRRELEPLIGFFVNTLMLRGDLSGDPRVREVLRRVRATTLDAFEHQEVPFEQLVAELQPERSLSHAPFVQVLVVLGEPAGVPRWPGVTVTPLAVDTATTKFDLVIGMTPAAGGLQLTLTYSAALFEPATIGRWGAHLTRVLTEMVAAPDQRSSALPLLTAAERVELLETWNQTAAAVPACTLPQLVEAQARATPAAVALRHDEARLTYGALQARANQVARHLRRLGVGPEQTVGVCVARGVELGVALLGVLNAGGAYVPLDPQYPRERVAFMLAHSGARVLLTQTALRAQWPAPADGLVVVCVDDPALARESAAPVASGVTPANLAYVIYTSGSTGTPKAVAIAHQSAVALVSWGTQVYGRAALAGMLAGTSICFDLSVFELFVPLAVGGCVIVVEHALAIATTAAAQAGRVINTVPSAIRELLHADGLPAGVTTVNLAGEPLTQDVVEALYARGIAQVYDLYGPSETTTYSTAARRVPGGRATIGRPIANTRAYVLDRGGAPVPIGIPGELYLGGAGLARGYLGAAAATASRFGPDPFGAAPGGRLYRTGDRVRWRADGTLEYLGRIDRQVKLRGFRIEPGEIEAALRTHPAVTDARVVVRAADGTAPQLVAYVIGAVEAEPLRAHLRQRLPEYLVPAAFLTLAAWPLTPTGKVDVRALPAPTRPPAAGAVRPRTPVEAQVAAVWRRVLGLADTAALDIHRNFFELGGNSLLVLRVFNDLRAIRSDLRLVDLFRHATVQSLAAFLDAPVSPVRTNLAPSHARAKARRLARAAR